MIYCQWNVFPESDLRDLGLAKDTIDALVMEKFRNNETHEYDRVRGTRAARFMIAGKRYVVEFTVEPQNDRPWIQAVELEEAEDV
jgi:hypothetical protein